MGIPRTSVALNGRLQDDSVEVVPGPEYEAGWLHRVFFGNHYRDLWTSPVRVKILNLKTFAGGLKPVEAGGGFQTKSLRFAGADGKLYKFRSVNKDPKAILPVELQNTFAADLAQDHISTSNPAGALIVDKLAGAVGVPRLHPQLVLLPDDPDLGEFRATFGGLLGIFETYPDDGFLGSAKIQNALKMFGAMEDDSEDRPDSRAYLTARLLDLLVGDWDRHVKQWKWARFEKENGRKTWLPIPMDRDQAFVRLDGVFPWIADMSVTQFENFYEHFNDIYALTFSGRHLDRRLLVDLDKPTWDSVVTVFLSRLTDEVIKEAVRALPAEYYEKDGARIEHALISRRDEFRDATDTYYQQLANFVDVYFSDKREYVEVIRLKSGDVDITAWRRDKETSDKKDDPPVYHRLFRTDETREIRLFMLGGDDKVVISGDVPRSIIVRVDGGKGDDELVDESVVHGVLWGFVFFIPQADHMTYFYDHSGDNHVVEGSGSSFDKSKE